MSEQLTLDDLDIIWMEDGIACFFADRPDICDIVEGFGFNIYYLIANQSKEIKPTYSGKPGPSQAPQIVHTSKIYKVVNNFVGRSVSIAEPPFPIAEFIDMEEQCTYNMPAIPFVLIEKLDQFFRLVDAQHGTESIVMLTYDLDKDGPEGWGILVPDQTNTSVHCNYDPDSIARIKPDNVMIVGSVHSHPGMAAYASGTDHADQADFDGVHITFGWQNSVNNGATQYYIELQMAGTAYKLTPEDVFEGYTLEKAPDPEVVAWTDKVKKVSPPNTGGSVIITPGEAYQVPRQTDTQPTQASTEHGTNLSSYTYKNSQYINYPSHISLVTTSTPQLDIDSLIICEATQSDTTKTLSCPGCFTSLPRHTVYADNCCSFCDLPLCEPDTTAEQIIWNMFDYCKDRNIQTDSALYLYAPDPSGGHMLLKLTPTTMDDYANGQWADLDSPTSPEKTLTLCCFASPNDCYCPTQVLAIDSMDFDNFIGSTNVYHPTTRCSSCFNYYDVACPRYAAQVVDFMNNKNHRGNLDYEHQIAGEDCSDYRPYLDNIREESYYS